MSAAQGAGSAPPHGGASPSWPSGDPDDVVRGILRDPAYQTRVTTSKPVEDPWKPFKEWMQDHVWTPLTHWIDSLGHALDRSHSFGGAIGIAIAVATTVLVVVLIARIVLAFAKRRKSGVAFGEPLIERAGAPADWRRRATDAAARGEYAAAIAALFRASLAALDSRAVILFDGARTPGEYRRLVRRTRPASAPAFDRLAEGFVRATYAPDPPGRADYDDAERALAAFEPALTA